MPGPLEGIRVLDWTIFQQGPIATCHLADMGAEVIKIEEPRGDPARGMARMYGAELKQNFYYQNQNRMKKGIVLDLTKPEAREVLFELVEKSDVFVTNLRYKFVSKLGLHYEALKERNPKIIYALSSGYGKLGPDSDLPSADFSGQARGGIWSVSMPPDLVPNPVGSGMADEVGGLATLTGILLALLARERKGVGQMVDASLLSGQIEIGRLSLTQYLMLGAVPPPSTIALVSSPTWNVYKCQDDRWLVISVLQSDKVWPAFCKVVGHPEWEKEPKYENLVQRIVNKDELLPKVRDVFMTKPRAEWVKALSEADIASAPVNDYEDVANDPQVKANNYIIEFEDPVHGKVTVPGPIAQLSETPAEINRLGPELGQHTEEVLQEVLGYSWEKLGELRDAGVY